MKHCQLTRLGNARVIPRKLISVFDPDQLEREYLAKTEKVIT